MKITNRKCLIFLLPTLLCALNLLTACGTNGAASVSFGDAVSNNDIDDTTDINGEVSANSLIDPDIEDEIAQAEIYSLSGNMVLKLSKYDFLEYYNEETATVITGSPSAEVPVTIAGQGAIINENQIALVESGTYIIRGEFDNNSFYINVPEDKKIHIVLDGANIKSETTSPIVGAFGDKMIITLTEDSVNTLTDSSKHANDSANGCLYSTMDVSVNGKGTLNINGNYNSGIAVKNDLKINDSTVSINAVNNGIKGNNSVSIIDSKVFITTNDDGIKSTEEADESKGFIFILDSLLEITATDDVMQAPNAIVLRGKTEVRGRSYGGFLNCKAGYVEGTELTVDWE